MYCRYLYYFVLFFSTIFMSKQLRIIVFTYYIAVMQKLKCSRFFVSLRVHRSIQNKLKRPFTPCYSAPCWLPSRRQMRWTCDTTAWTVDIISVSSRPCDAQTLVRVLRHCCERVGGRLARLSVSMCVRVSVYRCGGVCQPRCLQDTWGCSRLGVDELQHAAPLVGTPLCLSAGRCCAPVQEHWLRRVAALAAVAYWGVRETWEVASQRSQMETCAVNFAVLGSQAAFRVLLRERGLLPLTDQWLTARWLQTASAGVNLMQLGKLWAFIMSLMQDYCRRREARERGDLWKTGAMDEITQFLSPLCFCTCISVKGPVSCPFSYLNLYISSCIRAWHIFYRKCIDLQQNA